MPQLTPQGQRVVEAIAGRHGFGPEAAADMLDAVIRGHGGMAQFSHQEFGGSGQWMRGGMTMVSDMFNHGLKGRVDAFCSELAELVAGQPEVLQPGNFQAQSQSGDRSAVQSQAGSERALPAAPRVEAARGSAALFETPPAGYATGWWPATLGTPASVGSQNDMRYAYFPDRHRLAIDTGGRVSVYDTADHRISGFSQQQSSGATVAFASQHGAVRLDGLRLASDGAQAAPPPVAGRAFDPASRESARAASDVLATIERLGELKAKGVLSEQEFNAKKSELLQRL